MIQETSVNSTSASSSESLKATEFFEDKNFPTTTSLNDCTSPDHIRASYKQLLSLYYKAELSCIPRETEYISELVLQLLDEPNCPIQQLYSMAYRVVADDVSDYAETDFNSSTPKEPLRSSQNMKFCSKTHPDKGAGNGGPLNDSCNLNNSKQRRLIEQEPIFSIASGTNKIHDSAELRTELVNEWNWRRIRSLFLQRQYLMVVEEIDAIYDEEFFKWKRLNAKYHDWIRKIDCNIWRYAFLRCLSLVRNRISVIWEALERYGELMAFSNCFVEQMRAVDAQTVVTESESKSGSDAVSQLRSFIAKTLTIQGRILQSEGITDLATEKFIDATLTNLAAVPWVLSILIGTCRISRLRESEVLGALLKISRNDPISEVALAPFLFLSSNLPRSQNAETLSGFLPSIPKSLATSTDFWDLLCCYYIDAGMLEDARRLCNKLLEKDPLRWRILRIHLEILLQLGMLCMGLLYRKLLSYLEAGDSLSYGLLQTTSNTLMSQWPERPEAHFGTGLLLIRDRKYAEAIEKFKSGIEALFEITLKTFGQIEIQMYLLFYKLACYFKLGQLLEAQEIVEELELKYPESPLTELYGNRLRFAQLLLSSEPVVFPSVVIQNNQDYLNQDPSKKPLMWRNPTKHELQGDISLCNNRWDLSHFHYQQSLLDYQNASLHDQPIYVDRFHIIHPHIDKKFINIRGLGIIRTTLKSVIVLCRLRHFSEATATLKLGLSIVKLFDCEISELLPILTIEDDMDSLHAMFCLPLLQEQPTDNLMFKLLIQICRTLQHIIKKLVDNQEIDLSEFRHISDMLSSDSH